MYLILEGVNLGKRNLVHILEVWQKELAGPSAGRDLRPLERLGHQQLLQDQRAYLLPLLDVLHCPCGLDFGNEVRQKRHLRDIQRGLPEQVQ